jgi:hypothetical protein
MRWNRATKEYSKPELGSRREKIWFALLPRRVENKWIWLEYFTSISEYCEYMEAYEKESHYDLLLVEHTTIGYRKAIGWKIVDRKLIDSNTQN